MSVIAVRGFPIKCDLKMAIKTVARPINGNFEALNFYSKPKGKSKTCYFRLSDKLDPVRVVERLNSASYPRKINVNAFIPDTVPNLPLSKNAKIPEKLRRALRIKHDDPPRLIFEFVLKEIMIELQTKYPGLYHLSKKTEHQLLDQLLMKVFDRLKMLWLRGGPPCESAFLFSSCYRRAFPHFGDFQTVLSTLHAVEDAAGQPRTQVKESDLTACEVDAYGTIGNMSFNHVMEACNKYSEKITRRLKTHILQLKMDVDSGDTEEMFARRKVRQELLKMEPYMSMVIKDVIKKHLIPEKTPYNRVRIYGEPCLPSKELTTPFLRRYGAVHMQRSNRMYNLLVFNVPPRQYAPVMAKDGIVIGGSKITIRSSDIPLRTDIRQLNLEIRALFRGCKDVHMDENPEFEDMY